MEDPNTQHLKETVSPALWANHQWKAEWLDNLSRLRTFTPTPEPTLPEWPSQEQRGSDLIASAPVSDVSAPACANGMWPPLRSVSVAQKNKPSTMLSSNVQQTDLMDCTAWHLWAMRQSNRCSTPAPRSRTAKQWIEKTGSNDEEESNPNVIISLEKKFVTQNVCWVYVDTCRYSSEYFCASSVLFLTIFCY